MAFMSRGGLSQYDIIRRLLIDNKEWRVGGGMMFDNLGLYVRLMNDEDFDYCYTEMRRKARRRLSLMHIVGHDIYKFLLAIFQAR